MSTKLYIGGLSWNTDSDSLRSQFAKFGNVEDAVVIRDRETGRSRGFGFVTYANVADADNAISNMNNQDFEGRRIRVDKASAREGGDRNGGSSFRGGERSGGSFRGGDREGGSFRDSGSFRGGDRY